MVENIEQLVGAADRGSLFEVLGPKIRALTPEVANADSEAWIAYLRGRGDVRDGPIGTVGYCLGGRLSLRMAGEFPGDVGVAASFHGGSLNAPQKRARKW